MNSLTKRWRLAQSNPLPRERGRVKRKGKRRKRIAARRYFAALEQFMLLVTKDRVDQTCGSGGKKAVWDKGI